MNVSVCECFWSELANALIVQPQPEGVCRETDASGGLACTAACAEAGASAANPTSTPSDRRRTTVWSVHRVDTLKGVTNPQAPRSVKISDDERGGWSSDRPRREGGPARPVDISTRCRV